MRDVVLNGARAGRPPRCTEGRASGKPSPWRSSDALTAGTGRIPQAAKGSNRASASFVGMRVGVIGVQGDVSEHVDAVARAMREFGYSGEAIAVRRPADLARVDGLTIPGGESTTISK